MLMPKMCPCLRIILLALLIRNVSDEVSVQDPFQNECNNRKIYCHQKAICRLDLVTQLFYCQCLPGYTGDGINNCQEPDGIVTVSDQEICSGTEVQTCLITRAVGGNVTFSVSVSGYDFKQIAWFKFYASRGPIFHSYRRRLTSPANLLPSILLKNQNLEIELTNIREDDFYPNRFWAELEADFIENVGPDIEPYDDIPFELLNPSRIRYYFVLDSIPIDIGEYLIGDIIKIQITPYYAISKTAFVRWFKEPLQLSQFGKNITVLSEGTEGILIKGLSDDKFGHIRAVVYDFTNEIPGNVVVAQQLFNIRKDITKTCIGSIRSTHTCKCNAGFKGNGVHCVDIDECVQGMPFHCLPEAKCVNTHGSYKCQCVEGYDGDGIFSCIDIDECTQQQDNCSQDAICINSLGSFQCVCQSGYFGDGNQCIATSVWSPWSPWSICTATCGIQNKMRIRMCTHPESGMRCEGPSAELMPCEECRPCPVNGQWSEWSPWSSCSSSCLGIKTRVRLCNSPAAAYGGLQCSGPSEQSTACGNTACPERETSSPAWLSRDQTDILISALTDSPPYPTPLQRVQFTATVTGIWSAWTPWSICPVTCGMSMVKRSRVCRELSLRAGLPDCVGSKQEERSCGFPIEYCKYQHPNSVMTGRWM